MVATRKKDMLMAMTRKEDVIIGLMVIMATGNEFIIHRLR